MSERRPAPSATSADPFGDPDDDPGPHRPRSWKDRAPWLVVAANTLLIGTVYWTVAYRDLERTGWQIIVLTTPILAVLHHVVATAVDPDRSIAHTVRMMTLSVLVAIVVRIAIDVARDPTSHNLWPMELMMMTLAGLILSLPGALVGWLLRRFVLR